LRTAEFVPYIDSVILLANELRGMQLKALLDPVVRKNMPNRKAISLAIQDIYEFMQDRIRADLKVRT
jgi:hypothetical protein